MVPLDNKVIYFLFMGGYVRLQGTQVFGQEHLLAEVIYVHEKELWTTSS